MNRVWFVFVMFCGLLLAAPLRAEMLRPFVLGDTPPGDMAAVVEATRAALTKAGFEVVGSYSPYPNATVIAVTHVDLKAAARAAKNGGFGAAQRVAVTEINGKIQVSYANPTYIGVAYGIGKLAGISEKLKAALGAAQTFGAEGMDEKDLAPGVYRYTFGMPYFHQVDILATHADYRTAIATVEKNLAVGRGGTRKVYRIDLPGEVSVFGVAIPQGDGPDSGDKDTDKEIMDIIDFRELRSTAYLPYELMVRGREVIALRGRYRIAVHFPDTRMMGKHGFTQIMSAPGGIKTALTALAEAPTGETP